MPNMDGASSDQRYLYKYRAIDEATIDHTQRIFTDRELYFSAINQFNDPFDCTWKYSFDSTDQQLKAYLRKQSARLHPEWNRSQTRTWISANSIIKQTRNPNMAIQMRELEEGITSEIGVLSLSRIPDDILMWSHYANSHAGFCLQFNDDEQTPFLAELLEVSYRDEYPIMNPIIDNYEVRYTKALLTKATHWEYEKEWRVIDYTNGPGIRQFPKHLLSGVIFGCRISDEHEALLREWCKAFDGDVSLYRAKEAESSYTLDIARI